MNGHTTVGTLIEQYGMKICGPDGQPGSWHLERWATPNYSLCYFGTDPPGGHRHKAKWDTLLQQVREGWSGRKGLRARSTWKNSIGTNWPKTREMTVILI